MRIRLMVIAVAVATGLSVTTALAQHEEHHEDQAALPPGKTDTGKPGGMTSGKMLSQTMTGQSETGKLVDQLMKSFAAIETENDPTALQEKVAEHGLLLKQLPSVKTQFHRMDVMSRGMMGREDKSEHKN